MAATVRTRDGRDLELHEATSPTRCTSSASPPGAFPAAVRTLACAALSDERLVAVASIASVAPYEADGLDWLDGMGEENHVEFGKALAGEHELRPYLEHEAQDVRNAEPRTCDG